MKAVEAYHAELATSVEVRKKETQEQVTMECRQLLVVAATHAFSHIVRLDPKFNLDRLLDPITAELIAPIAERVKKDAIAFAGAFLPKVVDDAGEPAGASGQGEGEKTPGDGDALGERGPAAS